MSVKLSTKGRYTLQALMVLGRHNDLMSTQSLAKEAGIPFYYLEKLISECRQAGFVEAVRGNKGGVKLSIAPSELSLHDILVVCEEVDHTNCRGKANCSKGFQCELHDFLSSLNKHMASYLRQYTLSDLVAKAVPSEEMIQLSNSLAS